MLRLLYCNLIKIKDDEVMEYLDTLPIFMRRELTKYKKIHDRKSRLLARLMLLQCLQEENKASYVNEWERDGNYKPFIKKWHHFNISHSGNVILFLFGQKRVGIDIEEVKPFEYDQLLINFHPAEIKFIETSQNKIRAFYEIWVRKEAFLKAVGIGITTNLEKYDCTAEKIYFKDCFWYYYSLDFGNEYVAYSCSEEKPESVCIKEFEPGRNIILSC